MLLLKKEYKEAEFFLIDKKEKVADVPRVTLDLIGSSQLSTTESLHRHYHLNTDTDTDSLSFTEGYRDMAALVNDSLAVFTQIQSLWPLSCLFYWVSTVVIGDIEIEEEDTTN